MACPTDATLVLHASFSFRGRAGGADERLWVRWQSYAAASGYSVAGEGLERRATRRGHPGGIHGSPDTTENMPIRKVLKLDLRIGAAGAPFDAGAWAAGAKQVTGAKYGNGIARYEIPSAEWTGKDVAVGVRAIGANGKAAAWSNFAILPVIAPPETPHDVQVTDTAAGEHLVWMAKGDSFRIFRRIGDATDSTLAATTQQPEWTDHDRDFDKLYAYRVRTVMKLAGGREAEGAMSAEVSITPRDVFPPAAPAGLSASAAPSSIELSWSPNTERTMGTYSVYRSAAGAPSRESRTRLRFRHTRTGRPSTARSYLRTHVTAVSRTGHEVRGRRSWKLRCT